MSGAIRLLVIDDSSLFVDAVRLALEDDEALVMCGSAPNAVGVGELVKRLEPDVITMDLHMPGLDGLTAVERVMRVRPTPILVMTADPRGRDGSLCLQAMQRGAVDVVEKVDLGDRRRRLALCERIKVAARSRPYALALAALPAPLRGPAPPRSAMSSADCRVVGVAASTGGPAALAALLAELPPTLPACLLVVQHLSDGFVAHLASWLNELSPLDVQVARDGDRVQAGRVLIAPDDAHMVLGHDGRIVLDHSAPLDGHRPSATVLLSSIARVAKQRAVGVILSGMGRDGADGLNDIHRCGGATFVQAPETCVVDGMPRAAQALAAVDDTLPLAALAQRIAAEAQRRSAG